MFRTTFLLICIVSLGCSRDTVSQGTSVAMSRFQSGQLWKYKTRPGEESSRITIVKVESHPKLGKIIHIQLNNVAIKSPTSPEGISKIISHLPYSEDALTKSVTVMDHDKGKPEDWEDGYSHWKTAFDEGKAGIWSITVGEAIDGMEKALDKK